MVLHFGIRFVHWREIIRRDTLHDMMMMKGKKVFKKVDS